MLLRRDHKKILIWLLLSAFLVACMVMLGGYTRLSGSGLSITSWKPIHGTLPPLDYGQWQEEFEAYRLSPQFQQVNYDMTLAEFKAIFWPEFLHRLLGRAVGVIFIVPFAFFIARGAFVPRFAKRLFVIFMLGGMQGVVGWLMVASGLVNEPHVSHIRLAIHFAMALLIFALILWSALDVRDEGRVHLLSLPPRCLRLYKLWFSAICLQLVYGAFMAGLHGGLVYNTWPDMNGDLAPPDIFYIQPIVSNFYNNIATVQFIHRTLAVFLAGFYLFWWISARNHVNKPALNRLMSSVALILALQFGLGVITLLNMAPLPLAWFHQLTGLVLFAAGVTLLHALAAAKFSERHINA